ncbi:hypothetical protein CDL12_23850 [Handroanthus impetiginosus]|uniref:DC1 domain-containing protein n=1 Tax=Handroanthus impetiginosus TaxID=429701 RepID=A0A2G9GEA2_9LAMI|nr:hypothetical protein CDL12_23850 [Handroanthus impetiginosus]
MEYKHFSHQHPLTLYKLQPGQQFQCHGCHLPCHNSIFACWVCSFFLHDHCGNANRYVKHPSHTMHPLVLMPSPTYCSGSFLCNACGAPGSTFSYCCPLCEVDLHLHCAYLPPKVSHKSHNHEIYISFRPRDQKDSPEYCNICRKELSCRHWSYYCAESGCDFRVHTYCATSEVKPGLYQDDQPDDSGTSTSSTNQNNCVYEPQASAATPEEVLAEMFQLQMQLQMAQQLNQIFNSTRM